MRDATIIKNLKGFNAKLNEVAANLSVLTLYHDSFVSAFFGRWYTRAVLWVFGITQKRVRKFYRAAYQRMLDDIRNRSAAPDVEIQTKSKPGLQMVSKESGKGEPAEPEKDEG